MTTGLKNLRFILIDDSKIDLFVAEKTIKVTLPDSIVQSFNLPDVALSYFKTHKPDSLTIVIVDINMPILNGFQFLEEFNKLEEDVKKYYRIFILTSSQNANDVSRGKTNKHVVDVLLKPLTKQALVEIVKSDFES